MNKLSNLNQATEERNKLLIDNSLTEEKIQEARSEITQVSPEESEKLGKELFELLRKKKFNEASDLEKVVDLIKRGANVNYKDNEKETSKGNYPLYFCCRRGNINTFLSLIRAGADINITNNYGTTPCMVCARHNQAQLLNILIALDVDINAKCVDGDNAIISAKRNNSVECFELLRNAQAYLNVQNFKGESIFNLEHKAKDITISTEGLILEPKYLEQSPKNVDEFDVQSLILEASEKLEVYEMYLFDAKKEGKKEQTKVLTKNQTN